MFAVVQIGSSTRRSACITALTVRAAAGWACVLMMEGALVSAAAARPPFNTFRRVVIFCLRSSRAQIRPRGREPRQMISFGSVTASSGQIGRWTFFHGSLA